MKKLFFIVAVMFLFVGLANKATAQTKTAETHVTIVKPVNFTSDRMLDFGSLANTGGTATIAADDAGAYTGTATQMVGPGSSAKFTITGLDGSKFNIDLDNTTFVVTNTTGSGGETMTVSLVCNELGSYTFVGARTLDVFVGGSLTVAPDQVVGLYKNLTSLALTLQYE